MKNLKHLFLILFTGVFLTACANSAQTSADTTNDEKYLFPELEQVDRIRSYKINGWSDIDKQSLFVSVSPSTSYLIILRQPSYDLPYAHGINFSSSSGSSTIYAKFDRIDIINIQDNIQPPPAYIERIYKVENKEQKEMIKAKIKGETPTIENEVLENQPSENEELLEDEPTE